jgi:hypothetical protein
MSRQFSVVSVFIRAKLGQTQNTEQTQLAGSRIEQFLPIPASEAKIRFLLLTESESWWYDPTIKASLRLCRDKTLDYSITRTITLLRAQRMPGAWH